MYDKRTKEIVCRTESLDNPDDDYSPIYLERFFSNLLIGEQWDLRNRYLHIHPTKEWSVQPNLTSPTCLSDSVLRLPNLMRQRPATKVEQSTPQVQDKLHTDNTDIIRLVRVVGEKELSVKGYLLTVKGLALYQELTGTARADS